MWLLHISGALSVNIKKNCTHFHHQLTSTQLQLKLMLGANFTGLNKFDAHFFYFRMGLCKNLKVFESCLTQSTSPYSSFAF